MNNLILNIYSNKNDKRISRILITQKILNDYQININSDNFTELFETELLSDILEENNINSSEVYYELK